MYTWTFSTNAIISSFDRLPLWSSGSVSATAKRAAKRFEVNEIPNARTLQAHVRCVQVQKTYKGPIWQKRPTNMAKETYLRWQRGRPSASWLPCRRCIP